MAAIQKIGYFHLDNEGGFVCYGRVNWIDPETGDTGTFDGGRIPVGQAEDLKPGDNGVPDGAIINLEIRIIAGNDRGTGPHYKFDKSLGSHSDWEITGTTLVSSVHFKGVN